jgi:hypothetical protein
MVSVGAIFVALGAGDEVTLVVAVAVAVSLAVVVGNEKLGVVVLVEEIAIDCAPTPGLTEGCTRASSRYAITATIATKRKAKAMFL